VYSNTARRRREAQVAGSEFFLNVRAGPPPEAPATGAPLAFHRRLPGYRPTPLRSAFSVARRLGVGEVRVKVESDRFGLPAYKILGASWAIRRELAATSDVPLDRGTLEELRALVAERGPRTLVAATDGNHGRAVARVARWLGLSAEIFVPDAMTVARREAIASEGASVHAVDGSYDDAIAAAAATADAERRLIQDTAWPGYERVPAWIVEGYGTIFQEVDEQLGEARARPPSLVLVQIGVGSLAAAATRHVAGGEPRPRLVGVEAHGADCLLRSARAGRAVTVPGPHRSCMAGLNCGTPSAVALPALLGGMDAFVAIPDATAYDAMRMLAEEGIVAGESGAAGLGGLIALRDDPARAEALGIDADARVLLLVTEADTDPEAYRRAVGATAEEVRRRAGPLPGGAPS
jgi:diaminopropionate ammonia-lyase